MKEITGTDWNNDKKLRYFLDIVYAMENCCECEDIDVSFSDVEVEYVMWVAQDNE